MSPRPSLLLAINSSDSAPLAHRLPPTNDRRAGRGQTRILIADAYPLTRIGLHALLSREPDLEVVGEVARGEELESAIARLAPNLLILDINLPRLDAIGITRHLVKRYPQVAILVLTVCDDEEIIFGLLEAGARGYVLKEESTTNLLFAIREVVEGQIGLSSRVTHMVVRRAIETRGPPAFSQSLATLTRREQEVLALVGQGLSNQQIAEALCISDGTVRTHLNRVYDKTGLGGRSQAMRYAIAHRLVSVPSEE